MAKKNATRLFERNRKDTLPYLLVFIGSLMYIFVAFTWNAASTFLGGVSGSGMWAPLLYGVSVIEAVALFLLSVGGLFGKPTVKLSKWATLAAVYGGITLSALTAPSWNEAIVVLGFVFAYVGAGWVELHM